MAGIAPTGRRASKVQSTPDTDTLILVALFLADLPMNHDPSWPCQSCTSDGGCRVPNPSQMLFPLLLDFPVPMNLE